MLRKLANWINQLAGRHLCPTCKTKLGEFGYCDPCNRFPHRRWLTDAEMDWLEEVDFQRSNPEEYERLERKFRKTMIRGYLNTPGSRYYQTPDLLIPIYGADLVAEVQKELENEET